MEALSGTLVRLDTHVVVWLYTGEVERLSATAKHLISSNKAVISAMVQLELTYLHEIGRLTVTGAEIVGDLRERIGLRVSDVSTVATVEAASPLSWARDPFDRMIAADALASNCVLITKDQLIRENLALANW